MTLKGTKTREFLCSDGPFCVLIVVIVTQIYLCDKITSSYTHTYAHREYSKNGWNLKSVP